MPRTRGFTLIELMVVIVILGGLIAIVGPNVFGFHERANVGIANNQMANFAHAVQAYRTVHKRLPTSLAELTASTERTPEPFLRSIPKDPWGRPYEYRVEGTSTFVIASHGHDGAAGTDDDLRWPAPEE